MIDACDCSCHADEERTKFGNKDTAEEFEKPTRNVGVSLSLSDSSV